MSEMEKTELTTVDIGLNTKGPRGKVGIASAGLVMRKVWHASNSGQSLKAFARRLAKEGDVVAREWFQNKKGLKNQKRSEAALQRIATERQATKNAKHKTGKK